MTTTMKALDFFGKAQERYDQAFQAKIHLQTKTSIKLFKEALTCADCAIKLSATVSLLLLRARILNGLGQNRFYFLAMKDCSDALALEPQNGEAYALRGEVRVEWQSKKSYSDVEEIFKALGDLNEAIKLNSKLGLAYAWRADARHHLGLPPSRLDLTDLKTAAKLCPRNAWVRGRLGVAQYRLGLWDDSYESFSQALKLNPHLDWAYAWRSEIIKARGNDKKSNRELKRGLTDPLTRVRVVLRLLEKKQFNKALLQLHLLAALPRGEYPIVYRLQEMALSETGDYRGAGASLNRLAALDPSVAEWSPECDYGDFIRLPLPSLEDFSRRHGLYAQAHAWLGRRHMARGFQESALQEFALAIHLDEHCSWPYLWRAELLYLNGRTEEASKDIEKVLSIEKNHLPALSLQGQIFLHQGRFQKARAAFSRYLNLRAVDPEPYLGRARAYLKLGKTELAKQDAWRASLLRLVRPAQTPATRQRSPLDYSGHLFRVAGQNAALSGERS